jgi:hypothetical protein
VLDDLVFTERDRVAHNWSHPFDNDTAARDVLRSLATEALPANIRITSLSHLALAANYPTVGPQGEHTTDVNGLATSIELFLGSDVS